MLLSLCIYAAYKLSEPSCPLRYLLYPILLSISVQESFMVTFTEKWSSEKGDFKSTETTSFFKYNSQ